MYKKYAQWIGERLAVDTALMQERTARLSAEADLWSLRVQVTPTSVPPTVDHNALADSVTRAVVAAHSVTNRTSGQPCFLEVGQVPV